MGAKLSFSTIATRTLCISTSAGLTPNKESEELGDEVIARLNPTAGEVENLEVLFFSKRLLRSELFELPISPELRMAGGE